MTEFGSDLILARLNTLHPKSIDLSLARIETLLARLGHPERRLPPVVHIAGTNGKGSTLAMLDAMLTASGKRVHRYISPHLVRFNERILLHGKPIDETMLAGVLDECERANDGAPITFFEITTAAAFLAFGRVPADYLLLETGLGGRLDATNVVASPRLTLITPVSMDHESYLGNSVTAIAGEKAGIVKHGVPVLAGPQETEALAVLDARARALDTTVIAHGRDWRATPAGEGFVLETNGQSMELPRPDLAGLHQIMNAGLAAMAALELGVGAGDIAAGLASARWAARLQPIEGERLVGPLPEGFEVWLDGGHNPAAGEALASSLEGLAGKRPVHLVLGMLETKDVEGFLRPLAGRVASLTAVPIPNEALSRNPDEAAASARALGIDAGAAPGIAEAVGRLAAKDEPAVVLICGSLYLAGHVLRLLA